MVTDNGTGMDSSAFSNGFLRVASRLKERGERRSNLFHRRYTGAKGIGRLAAHKLARKIEIESVVKDPLSSVSPKALYAAIDWDEIERYETLDDLDSTSAIQLETKPVPETAHSGTTLILSSLRRIWTKSERARFFAEVQSFDPPEFLREPLPTSIIEKPLLFNIPTVRDNVTGPSSPAFKVNLEGEFAAGDDYWTLVAEVATWVLEIKTDFGSDEVQFAVSPTKKTINEIPDAKGFNQSILHPTPEDGPHFEARILVREGHFGNRRDQNQRVWAASVSGIRIYMEGFRVLPYGDQRDDWLSIDADYTRRHRQLEMLQNSNLGIAAVDPDEGLTRMTNNHYFGAVFLTQDRCPGLQILVNREGFIPDARFDGLVQLVRTGVDLCTRVRAAARYRHRQERRDIRRREIAINKDPKEKNAPTLNIPDEVIEDTRLPDKLKNTVLLLKKTHEHLNEGDTQKAEATTIEVIRELNEATEHATEMWSERSLLHVLASVGTQMAAFVHEINALLGAAHTIEHALEQMLKEAEMSREYRDNLRRLVILAEQLKRGLERQATYLVDIEMPDARRRRSRQYFCERFESAVRLVQHQTDRRGIQIVNKISEELRSPPMFPAELTVVFANLLTNAIKASGKSGTILATGTGTEDQVVIRMENTGTIIELDTAERWFEPFQSTTSDVDPVLGQGMGLGLTITRNLLGNYGAMIGFVKPERSFATAVEIVFPIRGQS